MLPFMGYNAGDYMAHWLEIGRATDAAKLPKLFWVNWFRKGDDGSFLWPGFGENSRVLKWVIERVAGTADATDTPIGRVPTVDALDTENLDVSLDALEVLLSVDAEAWRGEVPLIENHYAFIGDHLPAELRDELHELEKRLAAG
jgi:phosphoenolpyruvate carboxykinase (GTP)